MENRMKTLTRAYNFELRAENNETNGDHIVGRPIVYDSKTNLGYFDEIIERGALDKADLKDVRFLVINPTFFSFGLTLLLDYLFLLNPLVLTLKTLLPSLLRLN